LVARVRHRPPRGKRKHPFASDSCSWPKSMHRRQNNRVV